MIVPMSKVYIVTQSHNRDRLLDTLGQLGVVHVEPVDPGKAIAKEFTVHAISTIGRALQVLRGIKPSGDTPEMSPLDTAREALSIQKAIADQEDRLNTLHRKASQLTLWGNVELKQLEQLRSTGIDIKFFSVAQKDLAELEAECAETVAELPGREAMVAVIDRTGQFQAPEGAKQIPWPSTDLPAVRKEAAEVDASIKQYNKRLAELANLLETMDHQLRHYQAEAEICVVQNSGLSSESLFALKGWAPSRKAESLSKSLTEQNISAAVEIQPVEEQEQPPTLIEYPRWARPIKALFDMLGTLPGYEEHDVSSFFMVALPLFAAMLIGDGGYGMILTGAGLLFYRRIVRAADDLNRRRIALLSSNCACRRQAARPFAHHFRSGNDALGHHDGQLFRHHTAVSYRCRTRGGRKHNDGHGSAMAFGRGGSTRPHYEIISHRRMRPSCSGTPVHCHQVIPRRQSIRRSRLDGHTGRYACSYMVSDVHRSRTNACCMRPCSVGWFSRSELVYCANEKSSEEILYRPCLVHSSSPEYVQ